MSFPYTHPSAGQTKQPPSQALRVMLLVCGGLFVPLAFFELRSAARLHPFSGQLVPRVEVPRVLPVGLGFAAGLVGLVTEVLWLIWQHRAHKILHALRIPGLRFTPGWAVGWWFVPFANFVMPYQVNAELWRATAPRGSGSWKSTRVDRILPSWWGLYVTRELVVAATYIVTLTAFRTIGSVAWEKLDRVRTAREIIGVASIIGIFAALAAFQVVSKLDLRIQRVLADPPEPPRPDLLGVMPA